MSIKAKLKIRGQERELLTIEVESRMNTRENGKICSNTYGGQIKMSFAAQMYDDMFIEWMLEHRFDKKDLRYARQLYKIYDGTIIFYEEGAEDIILFEYNFKDATPINYEEEFNENNFAKATLILATPMLDYRHFTNKTKWDEFSPTRFISSAWMESYIEPKEIKPYKAVETETSKVTKFYYTDRNGTPKTKLNYGDKIFLVIESKEMNGEIIDVKLNEKEIDFLYKGKRLKNDTIKDYKITSNKAEIPLQVIPENYQD